MSRNGDLSFGVRRRGVTLIEAVLFIAVALGVIIGGLVFYQQASTALMARNTIQQLTAYGSEIRSLYERTNQLENSAAPGDTVNLEELLIKMGGVPGSFVDETGTQIMTPWGGDFQSWGVSGLDEDDCPGTTGTERYYNLILQDVPPRICTRIASFRENGSGVFSDRLWIVGIVSSSGDIVVYTEVTPDHCRASNGGGVPDASIKSTFSRSEAAAFCSQLAPGDFLAFAFFSR
jgi:hypothetical protein